jgi:hypothetical protein
MVLVLAHPGGASAADVEGRLRVTGRVLWDGNAPRDYSQRGVGQNTADGVLGLLASAEGRYTAERWQVVGRYDGGTRLYLVYPQENTLVQSAALEGSHALGDSLGLGLEGRAKDRRGGARAYTDVVGSAFTEYAPDARLALRLRAGGHAFFYRPDPSANFGGFELGALARYRIDRQHSLGVSGEYGARRYTSLARRPSQDPPQAASARRSDGSLIASVSYAYKGPLNLGLTYTYLENNSNSFGESMHRHRLGASVGVRLPWKLTLLAQGALGFNLYPDGIYLSPEIILLEDDESQNMLSARLARPLSPTLDVELSSALYGSSRMPGTGLSYLRPVVGVGLTWRP